MITYNTKLITDNPDDVKNLITLLEEQRIVFNFASNQHFGCNNTSIVILHSKVYHNIRTQYPNINSQVIIKAEQECIARYKSIKANKHNIYKPIEKRKLSIQLDKRLYSFPTKESIKITTTDGKKTFYFELYPKLKELLDKYNYLDPSVFVKDNQLYISLPFDNSIDKIKPSLALGVDLGIKRVAACSDGRIIIDKKFNSEKRKLRYLKRSLQSKGTKSARRHLDKLKHKEKNKNKNQTHLVVNEILKTNANVIVLENLKGIKAKKHKKQNKNNISQVPLFDLRRILTYKADNQGKTVILVSPAYTSQIDSSSGLKEGERRGCRFYTKKGLVYDADVNASRNVGQRSKHPVSYGNILDGQVQVNVPNVCKSLLLKQ